MRISRDWNFTGTVPSHCTLIICISTFQEFKWYISIFLKGAYILITTWNLLWQLVRQRTLSKAKMMHTRTVVVVFRFRRVCPCLLFHKVFFLLPSNLLNSSVVVIIFGTIAWKKGIKKQDQDNNGSLSIWVNSKLLLFHSCRNSALMFQHIVWLPIKQRKNLMISSVRPTMLFSWYGHTILHHRFTKCNIECFEGNYLELVYNSGGRLLLSNGEGLIVFVLVEEDTAFLAKSSRQESWRFLCLDRLYNREVCVWKPRI